MERTSFGPELRSLAMTAVCLLAGAAVTLESLHLAFAPSSDELTGAPSGSPRVRALVRRQLALWEDPHVRDAELGRMRGTNEEWDFMGRTYLVLALGNLALSSPGEAARDVAVIDRVIDDTLRTEREQGMEHFMMSYVNVRPWVHEPHRSLFLDGEIALMLATRLTVRDDRPLLRRELDGRVAAIVGQMEAGPVLSAESYPDECWTFCNTTALAALRVADAVRGTDHSVFARRWIESASRHLVDARTGMLVSSFRYDGTTLDGPEGSSLWMSAHNLLVVDPAFARDQYARARRQLASSTLGFGWAREWPDGERGPEDVDSGPIVPLVDASAGSSGLAIVGARAFGDLEYTSALLASLDLAAFPIEDAHGLRYGAGNQVGDAVLLYGLVVGPLWAEVAHRIEARHPRGDRS